MVCLGSPEGISVVVAGRRFGARLVVRFNGGAQASALARSANVGAVPDGDFADWVERTLGAAVGVTSHGPTHAERRWR